MRRLIAQIVSAIAVALLLVAPFFLVHRHDAIPPGYSLQPVSATHDMPQHFSVLLQYDRGVRDGAFYPRWQAEFNKGYGLPWLNYYPAGFYILCEPFLRALHDPIRVFFAVCVLTMAASAASFYRFARLFFSRGPSYAGALIYMIAPYHNLDLYWRGALPEYTAFVLVPLVALFVWRAATTGRLRDIALFGFCFGIYMLTHVVTAYLLAVTTAVLLVCWTIRERNAALLLRTAGGAMIGLAIGAMHWIPATFEQKFIREPFSEQYPYDGSYLTLLPTTDPFPRSLNHSVIAAALIFIGATLVLRRRRARWFQYAAAGTLFMVTPYSIYVAHLIPEINAVSFAWRWIAISTLCVAAMFAAAVEEIVVRRAKSLAVIVLLAAVSFSVWIDVRLMREAAGNVLLVAPLDRVEEGFLPGGATEPTKIAETPNAILLSKAGSADVERWGALHRVIRVRSSAPASLRMKTFSFPGWTVRIDGTRVPVSMDVDGAQLIAVPSGEHLVDVRFGQTRPRRAAVVVSIAGICAAVSLLILDGRRRRRGTSAQGRYAALRQQPKG